MSSPTGKLIKVFPWHHNPSSWKQRVPICILGFLGAVISSYMALYQWKLLPQAWDPVFGDGTERVLDSEVSEVMRGWFGIPDAALGAIAYLGDAIFGLAGSSRRWQYTPWLVILFGLDVIPLGLVSAVLVFMQGTVVGFWCFLCLVTAVLSLVLIAVSYDEVHSSCIYLYRVWKKSGDRRVLLDAFWGKPSQVAFEVGNDLCEEVYVGPQR
ncbi:MAG: vitamin K epoxide reductase family protein [Oligoflexales bacterium]